MLLGEAAVKKLNNSGVIIFGLGGVGSYTAEDGKLTFLLRFRNSPNRIHVEFTASGDDLTVDFTTSWLYDEDCKQLVGHRLV